MNIESNIQKIIEESEFKDLFDALFQLRYQYDAEYEALDGNTGSFWGNERVKKLRDDIVHRIRQETLEEMVRDIKKTQNGWYDQGEGLDVEFSAQEMKDDIIKLIQSKK